MTQNAAVSGGILLTFEDLERLLVRSFPACHIQQQQDQNCLRERTQNDQKHPEVWLSCLAESCIIHNQLSTANH